MSNGRGGNGHAENAGAGVISCFRHWLQTLASKVAYGPVHGVRHKAAVSSLFGFPFGQLRYSWGQTMMERKLLRIWL